jgi:hypothetical protein
MTTTKPLPSLDYLKECFVLSDDSPSGLVWKSRPRHHFNSDRGYNQIGKGCAGKPVGSVLNLPSGKSYWQTQINGQPFYVHRIVFSLLKNKNISTDLEVDHVDGNGLSNTRRNLRAATEAQNKHNSSNYRSNTTGFKGVGYSKVGKYWMGRVMCNGKLHTIRGCPTPAKAAELLQELREKLHKEFTNHG